MVMLDNVNGKLKEELASSSLAPLILRKSIGKGALPSSTADRPCRSLRFAMLGCEDDPPYGPTEHTGKLFLELISNALQEAYALEDEGWEVSIAVYKAKMGEYPEDWDVYDGILLTGSFSAAYDNEPWIEKLKQVIQEEIVSKRRPTLGICFGHQVLAHSFPAGKAKKNPNGSRGGRYAMVTTAAGKLLFDGKESLPLFYSHGDMVEKIPRSAVAIGSEAAEELPVQSAAYFKDEDGAQRFQSGSDPTVKPFAITFQAHPEYAVSCDLGLQYTLDRILDLMAEKELIKTNVANTARQDAANNFDVVQRESLDAFIASAKALGWFP